MNSRSLAVALFASVLVAPVCGRGPNDPAHQSFAMGDFTLESGRKIR